MRLNYCMPMSPGLSEVCPWERDHLLLGHTTHLTGLSNPSRCVVQLLETKRCLPFTQCGACISALLYVEGQMLDSNDIMTRELADDSVGRT